MRRRWMRGGQGRLPSRSNCKGPTRATVCSHSRKDVAASILPASEYRRSAAVTIGGSVYKKGFHRLYQSDGSHRLLSPGHLRTRWG